MSKFKQKGSSTVEFAMMVPLLLLLVFMVSELGIMFYRLNALTKSVQIAARYLSVNDVTPPLDEATAKNLAVYGNTAGTGTAIVPGLTTTQISFPNAGSQHVQVTATYPANWALPGAVIGLLGLSGDPLALKASSVMRLAQ